MMRKRLRNKGKNGPNEAITKSKTEPTVAPSTLAGTAAVEPTVAPPALAGTAGEEPIDPTDYLEVVIKEEPIDAQEKPNDAAEARPTAAKATLASIPVNEPTRVTINVAGKAFAATLTRAAALAGTTTAAPPRAATDASTAGPTNNGPVRIGRAIQGASWCKLPGPPPDFYSLDKEEIERPTRVRIGPQHCLSIHVTKQYRPTRVATLITVICAHCSIYRDYVEYADDYMWHHWAQHSDEEATEDAPTEDATEPKGEQQPHDRIELRWPREPKIGPKHCLRAHAHVARTRWLKKAFLSAICTKCDVHRSYGLKAEEVPEVCQEQTKATPEPRPALKRPRGAPRRTGKGGANPGA